MQGEADDDSRLRQLQHEREQLEFKKLQADAGLLSVNEATLAAERMDWMYEPLAVSDRDRQIEAFRLGQPAEVSDKADDTNRLKSLAASEAAGSLFLPSVTKTDADTLRKLREDPLFVIRQAELEHRRSVGQENPLHLKLKATEKEKRKKEKEKRKRQRREQGDRSRSASRRRRRKRRSFSSHKTSSSSSTSSRRRSRRKERERRDGRRGGDRTEDKIIRNHSSKDVRRNGLNDGTEGGEGERRRQIRSAELPVDATEILKAMEEDTLGPPVAMLNSQRRKKAEEVSNAIGSASLLTQPMRREDEKESVDDMLQRGKRHEGEKGRKAAIQAFVDKQRESLDAKMKSNQEAEDRFKDDLRHQMFQSSSSLKEGLQRRKGQQYRP